MHKNSIYSNKHSPDIDSLISRYHVIRRQPPGEQSDEELFEVVNSIAMLFAKEGFAYKALSWLKEAEPYTLSRPRLKIILNNNYACVYKQQNLYEQAIHHLKESEQVLLNSKSTSTQGRRYDRLLIDCWLNLTAICSGKGLH